MAEGTDGKERERRVGVGVPRHNDGERWRESMGLNLAL